MKSEDFLRNFLFNPNDPDEYEEMTFFQDIEKYSAFQHLFLFIGRRKRRRRQNFNCLRAFQNNNDELLKYLSVFVRIC